MKLIPAIDIRGGRCVRLLQGDFAKGFIAVGRVHLIGLLVAAREVPRGTHRIAEWAIKRGGILRRVSEDQHRVVAGFIERPPNRPDSAIHHVRRRDHIATGLGLHAGLLAED